MFLCYCIPHYTSDSLHPNSDEKYLAVDFIVTSELSVH